MENLNIIEYKPAYAKKVAEMWVKSSEGWNGGLENTTEETVLADLEGSTSINTYLAECNGEILGFCDFSEYLEDEGALYVKTLNVRTDYHRKGIGRTLIGKALERTIELGWPRLDLYTWSGNTKSIPLYKRCGFFFENRMDITHLMNFIPYVMKTEAVEQFFKDIDWYEDLKRTINMEPDGREENGFEIYEYIWEQGEKRLRMEFEKTGRGLRLIETEDYLISVSIPKQDLVFGKEYKIKYELINKSGKELKVQIRGVDDKNIKYAFKKDLEVTEKEFLEGSFYVGEGSEEVKSHVTHPTVHSEVLINGKKADFKLGILPKCPAKISLKGTESFPYDADVECYKNIKSEIYLDIENNFEEAVSFSFKLINNENIDFLENEFNISMNSKEKKSLKAAYILKNYGMYSEEIAINATLKNSSTFEFRKNLRTVFKGREGAFGGETDEFYIIVNGPFSIKQSKINNKIYIREFETHDEKIFLNVPKLGKPFSSEFMNIKVSKAEWYKAEEGTMILKTTCMSKQFNNLEVTSVVRLSANGIVEHYHEVYNNSEKQVHEDISLIQGTAFYMLSRGIIPVDNKIVQIENMEHEGIQEFNLDRITENWIFSETSSITKGFFWSKVLKPKMDDHFIGFEHNLGKLTPKSRVKTEAIKFAINTFRKWQEFRNFVLKEKSSEDIKTVSDLEIIVNQGNPFVLESFKLNLLEHKKYPLNGEIAISSEKKLINNLTEVIHDGDKAKVGDIMLEAKENGVFDIIDIKVDLDTTSYTKRKAVFIVKNDKIKEEILKEQDHEIYCAHNGVMQIKLSPSFSPALYSMNYRDCEWLESSFPSPKPKSWYNPWVGGILNLPEGIGLRNVLEEDIKAEFAVLKDSFGNEWRGIKSSFTITKACEHQNLEFNEYFLMLPGVPVLCHTTKIVQNSGSFMHRKRLANMNFFNVLKEDIKNNYAIIKDRKVDKVKYKGGNEAEFFTDGSILFGNKNIKEKLQLFTEFEKASPMLQLSIHDTASFICEKVSAANGSSIFTTPIFYIFTDDIIDDELLKDFRNIHF